MNLEIPDCLNIATNRLVLNYLKPLSCHGDNIEQLMKILKNYPDVLGFCPNGKQHKYALFYVHNVIFAYGVGMRSVAIKIPEGMQDYAVSKRATKNESIEESWYEFDFQSEYMAEFIDISYQHAIKT